MIDSPVDGLESIGALAMEWVTADAWRSCLGAGTGVPRLAGRG